MITDPSRLLEYKPLDFSFHSPYKPLKEFLPTFFGGVVSRRIMQVSDFSPELIKELQEEYAIAFKSLNGDG